MTIAVDNRVTADDYRALPEGGKRYQLIEGDLYMSPSPNRFHQEISLNIALCIGNYLKSHPVGKVFDAPLDVYLNNDNVFQPDLVFIARENYRVLTDAGIEGVPDLVIEILSPGTAKLDRNLKQRVYAQCGVKEMWLVDPETTTVAVYYLQQNASQPAAVYSIADRFTSSFLPDLVFSVADFFKR
jgi:Uma2 family endonuclease